MLRYSINVTSRSWFVKHSRGVKPRLCSNLLLRLENPWCPDLSGFPNFVPRHIYEYAYVTKLLQLRVGRMVESFLLRPLKKRPAWPPRTWDCTRTFWELTIIRRYIRSQVISWFTNRPIFVSACSGLERPFFHALMVKKGDLLCICSKSPVWIHWRPQPDSNRCCRRERPVSWTGLDDGDAMWTAWFIA
jgi:hypothetical protein